ncbi:hypothetical protein BKA93DRAFT_736546, partial [Sparassis latifolia]
MHESTLTRHRFLQLRSMTTDAGKKRENLYKPTNRVYTRADLSIETSWAVSDLEQLAQIMKSIEQDLKELEEEKVDCIAMLQEVESSMLKATTRKEEVVRFSRASRDAEFAKMLKARSLGPEHLETQSQLRRDIKALRDRIQQLEDHIQESKKKLSLMKANKPGIRAPSLDTINRICRNIDTAITQEEDHVAKLVARTAQLTLKPEPESRDRRLPDKTGRPFEVTPNVAMSTAAALNAEMSA